MRRYFLLVMFLFACVLIYGQRKITVLDLETHLPIKDVTVRVDSALVRRTNYVGQVEIPLSFRYITFTHMNYSKERLAFVELTDTMYMLARRYQLGEVVVMGINPDLKKSMQRAHDNMRNQSIMKGLEFDFGRLLDRRWRRDRKHYRKAQELLREWDLTP